MKWKPTKQAGTTMPTPPKQRAKTPRRATIAILGPTGTGKTTFVNVASGSELRIGESLQSCTNTVQTSKPFVLDDVQVTLIDTPGFDDTARSDMDILDAIAGFMAAEYKMKRKVHGVVYLHRITDNRVGGVAKRSLDTFREFCGDEVAGNVVIVTNMWGEVKQDVGEARETELSTKGIFFQPLLAKGSTMKRHFGNHESALDILRVLIAKEPVTLQIQREMANKKCVISETAAGLVLQKELLEMREKQQKVIRDLEAEISSAVAAHDDETRQELEGERARLTEEMNAGNTRLVAQTQRKPPVACCVVM